MIGKNDSEARKFFKQAKRMKERAEINIKKRNFILASIEIDVANRLLEEGSKFL
ncbi:MAG: hypothetical protein AMQ74_00434 [Candidatus Methanofastidiosum methylothiophilum]|uniref:Uncharacterized protein n=1 Tax=Candidatus Methanofastidiosum methylothiophilum TaxID=1705564 RepID=A0A150J7R4_9EURY|nr:MAG: hypothetical protein AMQ74_00434 [Candidatus Methanofastidiosum methylthiophilus]NMC76233.1 hypothetical protein [Candidatus Methanofastidiosa archaeon]